MFIIYFIVLIAGLSPEEKLHGVKYIIESFVGCIRDMVLSAGKAASDLLPIKPLIATKHDNVLEGCINKLVYQVNRNTYQTYLRFDSLYFLFIYLFRCWIEFVFTTYIYFTVTSMPQCVNQLKVLLNIVVNSCLHRCRSGENFCFEGSKCINHYNELSCDCFGTGYEGELCDIYSKNTFL